MVRGRTVQPLILLYTGVGVDSRSPVLWLHSLKKVDLTDRLDAVPSSLNNLECLLFLHGTWWFLYLQQNSSTWVGVKKRERCSSDQILGSNLKDQIQCS